MSMRPDDHRRKWDPAEFRRKALDRIQKIKKTDEPIPEARDLLKTREYKVDLDSKLGKSMVINKTTPSNQSGGYFCNVSNFKNKLRSVQNESFSSFSNVTAL